MRKLSAVAASMLVMALLVGSAGPVAAAVCTVPVPYLTIQAAVDAPACTIINVGPGAYAEQVNVHRSVQIFGAPGAVVTGSFTVNAANVTIDGFTVNNPTLIGTFGIAVKVAGSGSVISNNTLAQIGANTNTQPVVGIYLERGPDNVQVLNNNISSVLSNRSAQGILVGDSVSTNPSTGILIQGNSISNITGGRGAYGIQVNNRAGANVEIRGNTINNLAGTWAHAIGLEGPTPTAVVEDNSITGLTAAGLDAIAVFFEDNPFFGNAEVHFNNFNVPAPQYGIAVHPALSGGTVNGECNWWNSSTGPFHSGNPGGTGAQATDKVDYTPWLEAPAPSGLCIGGLESTPGKVTGGGQIDDSDPLFSPLGDLISLPALLVSTNGSGKANFGFVIQLAPGALAPKGNLTYHDQDADVRIKATSFDRLIIGSGVCGPNTHATIIGTADVNGDSETLTVVVDDCGEPSSGPPPDTFTIDTDTYDNGGPLIGGNIKIH